MDGMARLFRIRSVAAAVVATVLAGGGLAFATTRPSSSIALPRTTPQRLVAGVLRAGAASVSMSGTVAAHVAVGLPSLPEGGGPAGLARILGYLNGDHQIRVWASGDGIRVSELIEPASELSYVAGERGVWAWDSDRLTAYRIPAPPAGLSEGRSGATHEGLAGFLTPEGVANAAVRALQPTSIVRLGTPVRVAGRPAYALDVLPRTPDTLVGRIEIDVDARADVPLRVAVYARGDSNPALSLAYRTVSFAPIDPGTFVFTPPPGARVVTVRPRPHARTEGWMGATAPRFGRDVRVFGTGWSSVAAVALPSRMGPTTGGLDPAALLPISGPLFSAQVLERGGRRWILFGAVPRSRLSAVARMLR